MPSSKKPTASEDAAFTVHTEGQLLPWVNREWLLTNGIGGYAGSSVIGCNTRRYHALLCAATLPPVGRVLALSRIAESVYLDHDHSVRIELAVNHFRETMHPRGEHYLRSFSLWQTATWEYDVEGVQITKELLLCWKRNIVGIRYTIDPKRSRHVRMELAPFTPLRDFHGSRHRNGVNFQTTVGGADGKPRVGVSDAGGSVSLVSDAGAFEEYHDWWYGHVFPIESDRGLDDNEDLFTPGRFVIEGDGKQQITLWASTTPIDVPDWDAEKALLARSRGDWSIPGQVTTKTVRRLVRGADDFVVARKGPDGAEGTTIIAGYPWFADWGRDTFISLPGLLLTTGRFEQARQVLTTFGQYVQGGMVPNRFDDYTNEPSYNTVDASLWYIHAAFEYARLSGDKKTLEEVLKPACRKIIDGYRDGTRYNIHADTDGLIVQGDASTQLTWMDAKCGDKAFTPRQGKPVEINALWYHALVLMGETAMAAKVAESFRNTFWVSESRGLADGVNNGQQDKLIRPNQIFAVSLPNSPLNDEQQKTVVEVVRKELLTPVGLRTLARGEPGYRDWYSGPQYLRDEAYHNGTIWPWPIGAFLSAYLKVHKNTEDAKEQCRTWLQPLVDHLEENCLGQIAEIFEAAEPHRPVGCCAQAWSVAEVLRLAVELDM
ncbi:amylo-alpha-1,6-glucosidase [Humisphaera borealis]|uniref:Glycogen debranching enzyme family protein n=1 Tax=Humisphaera borealis TaxID=2807512 RepID=A0A7M2WQM3_9BACT|nr:amylo-alpha-1,6-glucosidase [Humisphaera borealis]QOV87766.1 glycogen debranching enzyme family protein [Humisphaera borealis]